MANVASPPGTPPAQRARVRSSGKRSTLAVLVWFTGLTGLAGGGLLALAPDGSLLLADPAALAGSPFTDYRWPGILLATLVGGGFVLVGFLLPHGGRSSLLLAALAGLGLIGFEVVEWAWLEFQPLQAVFATVGAIMTVLAVLLLRQPGVRR